MSSAYLLGNPTQSSSCMDPDNRDPTEMNKHLRLDFFNIIAEPDLSAYSFSALHQLSHHVYHYSKLSMYRLLTIFLGLPLMLFWGLLFGMYSFMMIWLAAPMRRLSQSVISEMGIYIQAMCDTTIGPIFRSAALIFSSVRLSMFRTEVHSNKEIHV